jgi:hypothetical protein
MTGKILPPLETERNCLVYFLELQLVSLWQQNTYVLQHFCLDSPLDTFWFIGYMYTGVTLLLIYLVSRSETRNKIYFS